jgi:hypothetical protein
MRKIHKKQIETTTKKVKAAFAKWMKPLGVLWWNIEIVYFDDPKKIKKLFEKDEDKLVLAKTYVEWKYMDATIGINVPAFKDLSDDEIERAVVHELLHVLVNEMREKEVHHEERVVTTLTKAFFWVRNDANFRE